MDNRAVIIYAYNETRGIFFYNGTISTRDRSIDALIEDGYVSSGGVISETVKPIYEGFKITEIDGLEPETEFFTADRGVGDGIFVTGSRMPEHYVDIKALGAGGEYSDAYYNYARDFHHVGEYYKLNIQYQGRWVKAYGMLKNYKITPQNVYKRTEITASFMILNPSVDANWHTQFNLQKYPNYDTSGTNPASTAVIDVAGLRNVGYPKMKITALFGSLNITADSATNRGRIQLIYTYRDANGNLIDNHEEPWNIAYYFQTGTGSNRKVNISGTPYSGKTLSGSPSIVPYIQAKINTDPTNRTFSVYAQLCDATSGALSDLITIGAENRSWKDKIPEPIEMESMQLIITKDGDGTIRWEAQ